jgi:nitroreductase
MMKKVAITKYPVNDLIKTRWSPRAFLDHKIREEVIFTLFEAASWAASSRNEQPWRFIYGIKDEGPNYKKIYDTLVHWNQVWAKSAPLLVMAVTKKNSEYHNEENIFAYYDLGQAVANLVIQATDMELHCHQMGGFDKVKARDTFHLPSNYAAVTAIAIGYLGNPETLPDDMRELEGKIRNRYDIDRIAFKEDFRP